jgi:hypothetical protein
MRGTIGGVTGDDPGRYNHPVRRLLPLLVLLGLIVTLAGAPAVLADDPGRDPRCADWEQNGAPPGIDMRLVCTANEVIGTYTGRSGADDLNRDPLAPYVAGLVVAGIVFAGAGIVAARFVGGKAGKRLAPERPDVWWACPSCRSLNAERRAVCYACHASRSDAAGGDAPMVITRAD